MTASTTLGLIRSERGEDGDPVVDWAVLPPDATVRVDGRAEFFIPRGGRRLVRSDAGYVLVSYGQDPRPFRQRLAAWLHRFADRVGGGR